MAAAKLFKTRKPTAHKLKKELESLNENFKVLYNAKEDIILKIEDKKLKLRQVTDSNKFYVQQKIGKLKEPIFSRMTRDKLLSLLDKEISLIQNQYDIVYNELKKMKLDLQDRIKIVDKTEFITNILNYKIYEVRYNSRVKLESLKDARETLMKCPDRTVDADAALRLVEIEKEISDCETAHETQMRSVKEQMIEAQKRYEDAVNILDITLENIIKYHNIVLLLIQAEKEQLSDLQNEIAEAKYLVVLEELQKDIDHFTELQTSGWRTKKPIEDISVLLEEKGLQITQSGLLITTSGHRITYEEAREQNLLDELTFSLDFAMVKEKEKDDTSSKQSKEESKESSDYTRMSSEDVQYLKENLGIPLTLALAEITSVQPRDPIHYLGHWLFKYRYNQEISEIQTIELQQLNDERERLARERWQAMINEEARAAVLECILRAEQEIARRELLRIQREMEAMEYEGEDEEGLDPWAYEARDKFGEF